MLQLRPSCEHCDKELAPNSTEAMICSYECTYCKECAMGLFQNVCPNCGGGFSPRPIRPKDELVQNPASTKKIHKPKDMSVMNELIAKLGHIQPEDR